jgi:hypothetical protein
LSGIAVMAGLSLLVLAVSGFLSRKLEINYSAD